MGTWGIHGWISFGLGWTYIVPKGSHTLHLEGRTRIAWHNGGYIDTFLTENVGEIFQSKAWNSFLNKSFTLGKLIFKVLGVTSWGKCLTMSVLLMTGGASCGTSCALGMFGIALLKENESQECEGLMEIAVGVARRDLPLFSCSCISHTPRASVEVGAAQRVMGCLHHFHHLFFFFFRNFEWVRRAAAAAVPVAVEVAGADWDPSVKRTVEMLVGLV